jgi:hypothetical protein
MNSLRPIVLVALLASTASVAAAPAAGRASDPGMSPVSLHFDDAPTAKVLQTLFEATGVRGDIDPCVTGRISISLEYVPLGTALDAIARMADLNVSRAGGPAAFRITCKQPSGRHARGVPDVRTGEPVDLHFRIEAVDFAGRREVRAEPHLVSTVGEIAEITETGNLPEYTLTDDGELIVKTSRPSWTVRAVVVPGRDGGPRELRGILEIASEASRSPESGVVSVTQPFHAALTGESETKLASWELFGTTWVLILAGVE